MEGRKGGREREREEDIVFYKTSQSKETLLKRFTQMAAGDWSTAVQSFKSDSFKFALNYHNATLTL